MDHSESGTRDIVYEILGEVAEAVGILDGPTFTKFREEACEKIADLIFAYKWDALEVVGKTEADFHAAIHQSNQEYIEREYERDEDGHLRKKKS